MGWEQLIERHFILLTSSAQEQSAWLRKGTQWMLLGQKIARVNVSITLDLSFPL